MPIKNNSIELQKNFCEDPLKIIDIKDSLRMQTYIKFQLESFLS